MFVLVALFVGLSHAAITDLNCTDGAKYTKDAFNCDDKQNDAFCSTVFAAAPAIGVGLDIDRPNSCWKDATAANEDVKQGAIGACPKTCGFCCQTPEYTCLNKQFPRITCKEVSQAQCKDPKWREIVAADCPNVCGMCLDGGCVDAAIECKNDVSICRNIDMQDFVKVNCKKTCGFCDLLTTLAPGGFTTQPGGGNGVNCIDADSRCAVWGKNGFCTNSFYKPADKQKFCARTCNMC